MTLLDLRSSKGLRVAGRDASRLRIANQDVWVAPWGTDYEDGVMPWGTPLGASGASIAVATGFPTRSGVRSLLYNDNNGAHAVRVTRRQEFKRGDVFSTWLSLRAVPEGSSQARLSGLCLANAEAIGDGGAFFGVLIDTRNNAGGSSASLQIRENTSTGVVSGTGSAGLIVPDRWYRLEAWIDTAVRVRLYDASGALLQSLARQPSLLAVPTKINPGIYSYGGAVFDDYKVVPV